MSQKLHCSNCGHHTVDTKFVANYPGCAYPSIFFVVACFVTYLFPTLGVFFWTGFLIALIAGIVKQRNHNRSKILYYECENCKAEFTWDGNKKEWV